MYRRRRSSKYKNIIPILVLTLNSDASNLAVGVTLPQTNYHPDVELPVLHATPIEQTS